MERMRHIYFLFPHMGINCGGHIAQMKFLRLSNSICPSSPVTYRKKENGVFFLNDIVKTSESKDRIFFIHWGPHVHELVTRLKGKNIVYVAHSTGWGFKLPSSIPIIAVSKHTQAYWGRHAPNSMIFNLPNIISENFKNNHIERSIDILIQKRKTSQYVLNELLPLLKPHCNLLLLDSWVDDLANIMNKSKIYLYDSTEHWSQNNASEGFGLPPLEAMACGCTVFSSVNDALSDYLDPDFNCYKLRIFSKEFDAHRILEAVKRWNDKIYDKDPGIDYRESQIKKRLSNILNSINDFFDFTNHHYPNIPSTRILSNNYSKHIFPQTIVRPIKTILNCIKRTGFVRDHFDRNS